jgi:hypothetical protein
VHSARPQRQPRPNPTIAILGIPGGQSFHLNADSDSGEGGQRLPSISFVRTAFMQVKVSLGISRSAYAPARWVTSSRATGEPARTFIEAAFRLNKISQALIPGFCSSGVSQHARPFAAGLAVCDLEIGCAVDHDAEWFRLHLRCVVLKAKSRPRILHRAVEAPPSRDNLKNLREVNIHRVAAVRSSIDAPRFSDLRQLGFDSRLFGQKRFGSVYPRSRTWAQRAGNSALD